MLFAFYITNHGFGHASRNVPIIRELLSRVIVIKNYVIITLISRRINITMKKREMGSDPMNKTP